MISQCDGPTVLQPNRWAQSEKENEAKVDNTKQKVFAGGWAVVMKWELGQYGGGRGCNMAEQGP